MAKAKQPKEEDPNKLKRERAGRYVTPDGRFAVEGNSTGSWYLVDSARENELGLPLMQGPFARLDEARDAVVGARDGAAPAAADLGSKHRPTDDEAPDRQARAGEADGTDEGAADVASRTDEADGTGQADADRRRGKLRSITGGRQKPSPTDEAEAANERPARASDDVEPPIEPARGGGGAQAPAASGRRGTAGRSDPEQAPPRRSAKPPEPEPAREPAWLARLPAPQGADARRLLAILQRLGIDDPALVRREIEANLPEVARVLLARRVQRDALEIWRDPEAMKEEIGGVPKDVRRHLRSVVDPSVEAAQRALARKGDRDDLAAFAWLVALRTAGAIFEAIDSEGLEGRAAGEPGWRLVELDARRDPTNRAITLDASDLLEPGQG